MERHRRLVPGFAKPDALDGTWRIERPVANSATGENQSPVFDFARRALKEPPIVFQSLFPGLFVFVAVFAILPSTSTKLIALSDVVSIERFVRAHGGSIHISSKYDYAIGLFPGRRNFDYLIRVGALRTPRVDNADEILSGYPPSKPRKIGRIFTRVGSRT